MMLIFKANSSTSCPLICWLTLTGLLRASESLSRTFSQQQMSFSKQQQSQLHPEIFRAFCYLGLVIHRQRSFTQGQRGLSLTCSGSQRTTLQQRSAIPRYSRWWRPKCGPLTGAKDVTFSVPTPVCPGVWFLWDNHAFPYTHEVVWNVRLQCVVGRVIGRPVTAPVVREHPTLADCGLVRLKVWEADL